MSNYITFERRMEVKNDLFNGKSVGEIANEVSKNCSIISRKVRKHSAIERSKDGANSYNTCVHQKSYASITEILQDVQQLKR